MRAFDEDLKLADGLATTLDLKLAEPDLAGNAPGRTHHQVLAHRHLKETRAFLLGLEQKTLKRQSQVFQDFPFVPHSGPFARGIFTTVSARYARAEDAEAAERVLKQRYAGEFFIRLVEGSPNVRVVRGTNFVDLGTVRQGCDLVVLSALDNLVKGMAGQALQNLNLMAGIEESAGLRLPGMHP